MEASNLSEELNLRIPRFDYMSQKNTYSGSCGNFRYKLFPQDKDEIEKVFVAAVYKDNCFEVEDEAGRAEKAEFEYSQEGIDKATEWIYSKY